MTIGPWVDERHRAHLDGLRCLAVDLWRLPLGVMRAAGGFTGVDVLLEPG